jgi:hypothetical protein
MKLLLPLFLVICLNAASDPLVNSLRCANASSCLTTWSPSKGNLLVVSSWGTTPGGTITDSQGNIYKSLSLATDYHAARRLYVTTLAADGPITIHSSATEQSLVVAEFSGVSTTLDGLDVFGGQGSVCSLSTQTTGDALLLSTWVNDVQNIGTCTGSSGTLVSEKCAELGAGQLRYELVAAGTHAQTFTFSPGYNAGNTNCGSYALKLNGAVVTPPTGTPGPAGPPGPPGATGAAGAPGAAGLIGPSGATGATGAIGATGAAGAKGDPGNSGTGGGTGTGMASQLGDLAVTRTSATVLTIGPSCSDATPCNVRIGDNVLSFTNPSLVTLSSGTGLANVYIDPSGVLAVGHNLTLACAQGCLSVSGVGAFTSGSIPLFSWSATNGAWDAAGGMDRRAFLSTRNISGGSGINITETATQTVVSLAAGGPRAYMSPLVPGPDTSSLTTGIMHGLTDDRCPLTVLVYDNAVPRNVIQVGWTVDPANCDVRIKFAVPQSNYFVVIL